MPNLFIMCGPSGSGKSTFVRKHHQSDAVIVSTDSIRKELYGDESIQGDGARVFKIAYERIEKALKSGMDVWFDAMNIHYKDRKHLYKTYRPLCDKIVVFVMNTASLNDCIERQNLRNRKVPAEIVKHQYAHWILPNEEEAEEALILYSEEVEEIEALRIIH